MTGNWYRAYGLQIHSQLPLPAPVSAPGTADVIIRIGKIEGELPGLKDSSSVLRASPEEICCEFKNAGRFSVARGKEIIIEPFDGVPAEMLVQWVQGAALSLVLHQRGFLVMHSSAVAIDNKAVIFVGESGWGKSTTAAALHARGHRLLADDVVAIRAEPGNITVVPGFPHLKLLPQSVEFLGEDFASMPGVGAHEEKRLRSARERFTPEPVPLEYLFVLAEADRCMIEPLGPQPAIVELLRHAFVARLTEFLKLTDSATSHFANCTQVIKDASVCALKRPKTFDQLPAMIDMIEQRVMESSCAGQRS